MNAIVTTRKQYATAKINMALNDLERNLASCRELRRTERWDTRMMTDLLTHQVHRAAALIMQAEAHLDAGGTPTLEVDPDVHVCGEPLEFWCDGCRVLARDAGMAL